MEPVRIKYYGLVRMTKSAYLWTTAIAGAFAIGLLVLGRLAGNLPPFRWPWEPVPEPEAVGVAVWLYNHLYDIVLFCIVAEAIDVVMTLRAFARKEAEQRAAAAGGESIPPQ
jgi:hypothetical protein